MHAREKSLFAVLLLCASLTTCSAQSRPSGEPASALSVQEQDGGSIVTNLSYGIQVDKGSTLKRKWYVVNDPTCPVQLSGTGVSTRYKSSSIGGDYHYEPVGQATAGQPVAAVEIRFLLFDVFGDHMKTLSATHVTDLSGSLSLSEVGSWRAWENEVSEMLTVASFVARVRLPDGRVWNYDPKKLLKQIEIIKVKLTEKELTPEKEKPKG